MAQHHTVQLKDSISASLIKVVFSLYCVVAIAVTLVHLVAEYFDAQAGILEDLMMFQNTFEGGVANEVWNLDDNSLRAIVQGMVQIPIIVGVRVEDTTSELLLEMGSVEDEDGQIVFANAEGRRVPSLESPLFLELFSHSFPIQHVRQDGQVRQLGFVHVFSSTHIVFQKVRYGITFILVNSIIKTVALWIIFFMVAERLLSRPLLKLTASTDSLNLDNLENLSIDVETSHRNELGILTKTFNAMIQKLLQARMALQESLSQLKAANQRLELLTHEMAEMAGLHDRYHVMIHAANTILQEVEATETTEVRVWFFQENDRGKSGYSCFHFPTKLSRNGKRMLALDQLNRVIHVFHEQLPNELIDVVFSTRNTECVLIVDKLILIIRHERQLLGLIEVKGVESFTREDEDFLKILGHYLTISLEDLSANLKLVQAKDRLEDLNEHLEQKVEERTRELADTNQALQSKNQQLENLSKKLSKYLAPQVYDSIFSGKKDVKIETYRKKLTVFFSDIKGFTQMTDSLEPEVMANLLNQYLTEMAEIALRYGGTIDKFIGDAIMIFFGDPETNGEKNDALSCVLMAVEMRERLKYMRKQWHEQGIRQPLQVRTGINTGYCTVGNFGSENRLDYTIIGGQVNLASRLESMAESGQILISKDTFVLVRDQVECVPMGEVQLKGITQSTPAYQVVDLHRQLALRQKQFSDEGTGFSLDLDFEEIPDSEKANLHRSLKSLLHQLEQL